MMQCYLPVRSPTPVPISGSEGIGARVRQRREAARSVGVCMHAVGPGLPCLTAEERLAEADLIAAIAASTRGGVGGSARGADL